MKFLTDEGVPKKWANELRLLGFDVVECTQIPELVGKHEIRDLLPWANRRGRILLSCDGMTDRETRKELYERLHRTQRGRVMLIKGGPQQPWTRAIGKVLLYHERWSPFFDEGHGLVTIRDEKDKGIDLQRIAALPRVKRVETDQGWDYMYQRRKAKAAPANPRLRRPRNRPAPAGIELISAS